MTPYAKQRQRRMTKCVELWASGMTMQQVATRLRLRVWQVQTAIENYRRLNPGVFPHRVAAISDPGEVLCQYNSGATIRQLADKFSVTVGAITSALATAVRNGGTKVERRPHPQVPPATVLERWNEGRTIGQIASEFAVCRLTITRTLQRAVDEGGVRKEHHRATS